MWVITEVCVISFFQRCHLNPVRKTQVKTQISDRWSHKPGWIYNPPLQNYLTDRNKFFTFQSLANRPKIPCYDGLETWMSSVAKLLFNNQATLNTDAAAQHLVSDLRWRVVFYAAARLWFFLKILHDVWNYSFRERMAPSVRTSTWSPANTRFSLQSFNSLKLLV